MTGYYRHHRQWRVMNELASIFDGCDWMIVHVPFVHSHGQSRSAVLCDTDADMEDDDDMNADHQQLDAAHQQHQILDDYANTNDNNGAIGSTPDPQSAEQTQPNSDPILEGENDQGEEGDSHPLLEQEDEYPGEVNPNLPGSTGYTLLAARGPEEEKANEVLPPNDFKMGLGGSHDLAASEESSDHRHREDEHSAKVRPKAKPLKLPKVLCKYINVLIF